MSRFRSCLTIINTRSGWCEGRSVYASALQQYLDRAGIVHRDVCVPAHSAARALARHGAAAEALVLVGGDGTLRAAAGLLATAPFAALRPLPLVLVPCGLQNSVAASLGVHSAARAVSAFAMGRVAAVPLWAVRVDGGAAHFAVSHVSAGAHADAVRRMRAIAAFAAERAGLPAMRGQYGLAALCTAAVGATANCEAEMRCAKGGETRRVGPPLRMLIAAQMPMQHRGYSLTPAATFRQKTLAVTTAAETASRARMLHLLRKEATTGEIIAEDGVEEHRGVESLTIRARGDIVLTIDGDPLHVPAGAVVDVRRAETEIYIAAC